MPVIPLPYSDGDYVVPTVFDMYCGGDGTALQGRALGYGRDGDGGIGVVGTSDFGGVGVFGVGNGFNQGHEGGAGVVGTSELGVGVYALSTESYAISAESNKAIAVYAVSTDSYGVSAESKKDTAVYAVSSKKGRGIPIEGGYPTLDGGAGVHGRCDEDGGIGVHGSALGIAAVGLYGEARSYGVYAVARDTPVFAGNPRTGRWASLAALGRAGYFYGPVRVIGDLEVVGSVWKNGGGFRIDHPLEPETRFLCHSFVESPEMKNVYDGTVVLNARGEGVVALPAWFQALNKDFRYQLTAIGAAAPDLHIAQEVRGNRFKIAGGNAKAKVSWQVTGVRKDSWANANRLPVEVTKSAKDRRPDRGPERFGQLTTKDVRPKQDSKQRSSKESSAGILRSGPSGLTAKVERKLAKLKKHKRRGAMTKARSGRSSLG